MQIGTALIAPEGFEHLQPGLTYYFLYSNRFTKTVLLLLFGRAKGRLLAHLCALGRGAFEHGLNDKKIIEDNESHIPAPFAVRQGHDLAMVDLLCTNPFKKKSDQQRAQARLCHIAPFLDRREAILTCDDPVKEINRYATRNRFNAERIRLWFFSYLCFGQGQWILAPQYFNCGKWDRLAHPGEKPFGRQSIARSKRASARLDAQIIEKIIDSYRKRRADGRTMTSIYREAMARDFKAKVVTDNQGNKHLVGLDSSPLPSLDQYRYQIRKAFGQDDIDRVRWGATRHRRRNAQHGGKFSSAVSNVYECVEADAYYCEERPTGYDGEPTQRLCVARVVDTASAMRLGIGFAFGAEDSDAYQAAYFCAAISKKKFCALFGIDIDEDQWPSQGVIPRLITDRGPGIKGTKSADGVGMLVREITPSGQGQSKGIVESSQRRRTQLEGPARYPVSALTPYKMAVREIRRALAENQSANASGHMTPEMTKNDVAPNPTGVFRFLDSRGRTDAVGISFDEAVRKYLKEVTVTVGRDGVTLLSQRYNSNELQESGVLQRTGRSGVRRLKAFVMPMCVRYIWVCVGSALIEVQAELNLRDDDGMLYQSLEEMEKLDQLRKRSAAEQRTHGIAAGVEQLSQFEDQAQGPWHTKKTVPRLASSRSRQQQKSTRATTALLTGKDYV